MNKGKKECLKLKGEVKEALPGCKFLVNVTDPMDIIVTCSLSGKKKKKGIRIVENDMVEIEVSVYDLNNGRIVWRIK